jgi:spore coat polysaccharide biosynthesis protein SpsF
VSEHVARPAVVVQARMRAYRLPGKTLADVGGRPVLDWLLERLALVQHPHRLIVAASVSPEDDPVAEVASRRHVACFRGSEDDVLARYAGLVEMYAPPFLAFLGADQPLVDPADVDRVLAAFRDPGVQYVRTYGQPYGIHLWGVSGGSVRLAARSARSREEREHMGAWWDHHPDLVPCRVLSSTPDLSEIRLTIDHPADLELHRKILGSLRSRWPNVTTADIIEVLGRHPDWTDETRKIAQWRWEGFDATVKGDQ